jgi:hypothetical protein
MEPVDSVQEQARDFVSLRFRHPANNISGRPIQMDAAFYV